MLKMKEVRSWVLSFRKFYYMITNSKLFFLILIVALFFLTIAVRDIMEKTLIQ